MQTEHKAVLDVCQFLEKRGFKLFFDDGKLIDIQVRKADGVAMLPAKGQKEALKVVESDKIAQKWLEFFVLKKKPAIRKITKRL